MSTLGSLVVLFGIAMGIVVLLIALLGAMRTESRAPKAQEPEDAPEAAEGPAFLVSLAERVKGALTRASRPPEADAHGALDLPAHASHVEQLALMRATGLLDAVRVEGDLHVPHQLSLPGGLIVRGSLHVASGGELDAPTEVLGDLHLGAQARALHPLYVHGDMHLGENAATPTCHVTGRAHLAHGARVLGALECGELFLARATVPPARTERLTERIADLVTFERVVTPRDG